MVIFAVKYQHCKQKRERQPMKKLAVVLAVTATLAACGTTGTTPVAGSVAPPAPAAQPSLQTLQMNSAVEQAPIWMSRLPKTAGYIFENGTATSSDFGFADIKAKTMAYAKICTAAGGKIRSQTRMFKSDTGDVSVEQSEMAMRSMCPDVDITGVETVEMKHVSEGNRIRTYVLVALPLGDKNVLKSTREAQIRAQEAQRELDNVITEPAATPAVRGQEISVVKPDGTSGALNLMPVDNAEYRARREQALKKPGAVIGQTTIRF
jgi:predicted small lipoprotein YifL